MLKGKCTEASKAHGFQSGEGVIPLFGGSVQFFSVRLMVLNVEPDKGFQEQRIFFYFFLTFTFY